MTDRPGGATPPTGRRPADRLHLSSRHRTQIVALLREHLPGVEVWAYGSRITGESHDGSDLDLVLRAPDLQKIPIGRLSDLWEALRESTIPFLVEARDWARLPAGFTGRSSGITSCWWRARVQTWRVRPPTANGSTLPSER